MKIAELPEGVRKIKSRRGTRWHIDKGTRISHLVAVCETERQGYYKFTCDFDKLCESIVSQLRALLHRFRHGQSIGCNRCKTRRAMITSVLPTDKLVVKCNSKLAKYKNRAKTKGIPFLLSNTEAIAMFLEACHYCGQSQSMGIDRLNNDHGIGYITGNVKPCCKTCNLLKMVMGEKEFILWAGQVACSLTHLFEPES